jgi:hypothetical protein
VSPPDDRNPALPEIQDRNAVGNAEIVHHAELLGFVCSASVMALK